MNAKISVFVICDEMIIYLLLYNLYDHIFKVDRSKLHCHPHTFEIDFENSTYSLKKHFRETIFPSNML